MLLCNMVKRLVFLITFWGVTISHLHSATIFAIGGVEPRLLWRSLASLPAEIHFLRLKENWEGEIQSKIDSGEVTIVAVWGPDALKVTRRLVKKGIIPDWTVMVNPGCIMLPERLQLARFPHLFTFFFPITGKWWISSFLKWAFKPRSPTQEVLNSYIYYWSKYPERISELFSCDIKIPGKYGGKTIILITTNLTDVKSVYPYLPLHLTLTLRGMGLFPQEVVPFYVNGIFSAILKRRMR